MGRFIVVGGVGVILAVFGICFFIFAEVLPLFQAPSVRPLTEIRTDIADPIILGSDEWTERPFIISAGGDITWVDVAGGTTETASLPIPADFKIHSWDYHQTDQELLLGSSDGRTVLVSVTYKPIFAPDAARTVTSSVKAASPHPSGQGAIEAISFNTGDSRRTVGVIAKDALSGVSTLQLVTYVRKRSLFGAGTFKQDKTFDLTDSLPSEPVDLLIGTGGQELVARLVDDRIAYFRQAGSVWTLEQLFQPFPEGTLASMHFLQGAVSLNLTSATGENAIFSLTPSPEKGLQFVQTKSLVALSTGATNFKASIRNKAYLVTDGAELSLRYATTEKVRWQRTLDAPLADMLIGEKYDRILVLSQEGELEISVLDDPHPEAGIRAFFGKIWYEGQGKAKYTWQSTGGTDDFEPKLSLIPLISGSLKGTFYALLFAVPIALLAAIYTSQFLRPGLKQVIKPTMEIMASLPSVVLGFLGALWLAPILDNQVPSFILLIVAIVGTASLVGYIWNRFPVNIRVLIPSGSEFVVFLPILLVAGWVGWKLGPAFEGLVFNVVDPATGTKTADFRLWWSQFSGESYQQRNSLVVGIMMGFAVIPLIFTIAEDALSNVPRNLVSASLALGASRWQTTMRVVLPGAAAGIFSALIIGLGRAVGETMIVVMATGNTAIMDVNIFTGMRTLSANIAVELPEAPHGGTLYRTLFLGAFVLFVLTFTINTLAELLRQKLRDRYKVSG
tara:strand:+ start:168193 stop:170388 length:2196 start_codon:yes stop_codon:yes gene_type:complete